MFKTLEISALCKTKKKETNGRPGKHNKGPKLGISIFFGTMRHFFDFFVTGKFFKVSEGIPFSYFGTNWSFDKPKRSTFSQF